MRFGWGLNRTDQAIPATFGQKVAISHQSALRCVEFFRRRRFVEPRAATFEDVHAVAVRIAARKLTPSQNRDADREAKKLSQSTHPRHAGVKLQLYRIGFLDAAARLVGDDCFGFNLAKATDTRELGIIHYVFASSATALDAIKNLVRYHHLVNSTTTLALEETNQQIAIEVKFRPGLESFEKHIAEWGPTTFVAVLRFLTGVHIAPRSLTFIHQRTSGVENFRAFFGCPVRFGANRECIVFTRNALLAPIHTTDKFLLNLLKAFCEEAIGRRETVSTTTRASVEKALLEFLPNGKATVANVATALIMSPRSLARRLADEGTSYTAVLDELRRDLAMRHLEDPTLAVSHIAWLLGYSEVTSFNHAFQRWTSRSPKMVRARLVRRSAAAFR
jgi:AraC-like DNA-binding protein